MTSSASASPVNNSAPPPSPRPLTPRALLRAWCEPRVRFWWLAAVGLILATGYFSALQTHQWWQRVQLLDHGLRVEATTGDPERVLLPGKMLLADAPVRMDFQVNGQAHSVTAILEGRNQPIILGSKITLLVDPGNPEVWTWHMDRPSLARELLAAWILLPGVPVLVLIGVVVRKRLLRCWRTAEAHPAVVLGTSQTALAPLSRAVRCTLTNRRDRRVFTVFVPSRTARLNEGDTLWLLVPSARSKFALAVLNFQ